MIHTPRNPYRRAGNSKGGSITVPLTSCLTGLKSAVWQLTTFVLIWKAGKSKPVKQEGNGTVILPPLVFPEKGHARYHWPPCTSKLNLPLFLLKLYLCFFEKRASLMRRSSVLSLPLQLVFLAYTILASSYLTILDKHASFVILSCLLL